MIFKPPADILPSEITSESAYLQRRDFLKYSLSSAAIASSSSVFSREAHAFQAVNSDQSTGFYTDESLTPYNDVTSYNNYYEFGMSKTDPARYAGQLTTKPWSVTIEGLVVKPGVYNLEDLLSWVDIEERIYRLRCVEAWSMVIPWLGFSLADLINKVQPTAKAKYIEFETLVRRSEMPGVRSVTSIIDWPYREGLRLDEAMNPLSFMATGLYGKELPNQNGAPLRLVVPWKYGFKSIKSIVKIRFVEKQPNTTWQTLAPREYGFYANVNPDVDHPRWSQRYERRLPASLFSPNRIKTQLFNGYAEQVAYLYSGMNLKRYY